MSSEHCVQAFMIQHSYRCHATPKINFYHLRCPYFAIYEIALCTILQTVDYCSQLPIPQQK